MVVVFNIIESIKIIDKEITGLTKKSDNEINDLYAKEIENVDPKVNFLYQMFDKHYKDKIFISNLKLLLNNHNLSIHLLSFVDETEYIKNFGYNQIKEIGQGSYGTVYLCKKNAKKYAIKMQKFDYIYGNLEHFLKSNITAFFKKMFIFHENDQKTHVITKSY